MALVYLISKRNICQWYYSIKWISTLISEYFKSHPCIHDLLHIRALLYQINEQCTNTHTWYREIQRKIEWVWKNYVLFIHLIISIDTIYKWYLCLHKCADGPPNIIKTEVK